MKKIALMLCIAIMMLTLFGCNSIKSQSKNYAVQFDPKDVVLEFEPKVNPRYHDDLYYVLCVTNNTKYTITDYSARYTLPNNECLEMDLSWNHPFAKDPIISKQSAPITISYEYRYNDKYTRSCDLYVGATMHSENSDKELSLDDIQKIIDSAKLEYETIEFSLATEKEAGNSLVINTVPHSYTYVPSTNKLVENY